MLSDRPSRARRLVLGGFIVFFAGFVSVLILIPVEPPADFPPWLGNGGPTILAWGWLSVVLFVTGAVTALVGAAMGGLGERTTDGPTRSVPPVRREWWVWACLAVIVVAAIVPTYYLGNPSLLGLDAIRWAAAALIALGAAAMLVRRVRIR